MKILTILGARPQFIKAGSVSRAILDRKKNGADIEEVIVHTGQHYDSNMSDVFFDEMCIPRPDYFLGIGGTTHGAMTGQMVEKIEEILLIESPEWVLVYGDTNSTLAGAIAASKLGVRIAHIEAGLRSYNMAMPEEINRILTDRVSTLLFCPTQVAVDNLYKEGCDTWGGGASVVLAGDVMMDGALYYLDLAKKPSCLVDVNAETDYVLATVHRAENTDRRDRLEEIISALSKIAEFKKVIFPLHPRTKNMIDKYNLDISKLSVIDPVGYLEMVWLISNCDYVMTDSGGLQKEAFFFRKYCITLRDETEWTELVDAGVNHIVGADQNKIIEAVKSVVRESESYDLNLYGDGFSSFSIIDTVLSVN